MQRHQRKRRVLIVEDRPPDVRLTRRALKKAGYDVDIAVAENGREALDYLTQGAPRPDLVLLDWMMPLVNGEEVLEYIKSDSELCGMPVIVLTTSASENDVATAYNKGCNAYLTKPVDLEKFQNTIKTMSNFWLEEALLP